MQLFNPERNRAFKRCSIKIKREPQKRLVITVCHSSYRLEILKRYIFLYVLAPLSHIIYVRESQIVIIYSDDILIGLGYHYQSSHFTKRVFIFRSNDSNRLHSFCQSICTMLFVIVQLRHLNLWGYQARYCKTRLHFRHCCVSHADWAHCAN